MPLPLPRALTLVSKRFLFVLQTKGFSQGLERLRQRELEKERGWWKETRGGEKESKERGVESEKGGAGKQGQNYYIFCSKARTAPFAELRIAIRPRLRPLNATGSARLLLVLTNFRQVICFNSNFPGHNGALHRNSVKLSMRSGFSISLRASIISGPQPRRVRENPSNYHRHLRFPFDKTPFLAESRAKDNTGTNGDRKILIPMRRWLQHRRTRPSSKFNSCGSHR